jgi:pyruvate kinase
MNRRAKIVATLGPATEEADAIRALLRAGVDVVRLNLSHGTHDWHRERIRRVRELAHEARRHVPVVLDLMGPRFRLAPGLEPRRLTEGETVVFGAAGAAEGGVDLPVDDPGLLELLRPGERVLIDQGLIELTILDRDGGRARARVVAGGEVASRKGINLPDSDLGFAITDKDRADIAFAVGERVEYLAASYIGRAADLAAVRRAVAAADAGLPPIPIIAKLERGRAVANLGEIVAAADAVMVARGDLGVEVPLYQVPVLQKRIIAAGRALGRPVIVATQMLESMMEQPRPTRAEATDVANAVFDGADALMLSGETAAGHHPIEVVETMARIITAAEDYQRTAYADASDLHRSGAPGGRGGRGPNVLGRLDGDESTDIPDMVSAAAVYAAHELRAQRLVAFSQSGATGRLVARYRPSTPIVVFANDRAVARRLQLVWGVRPHLLQEVLEHHDEVVEVVDRELLAHGLAEPGQLIVVLMGDPIRERRQTNLMRVHRVRTAEDWERARRESRGQAWGHGPDETT